MTTLLFWTIVALAFGFGVTNGFIGGGSLVSAIITTRSLSPLAAVAWVAAGEILGVFVLGQILVRALAADLVVMPTGASAPELLSVIIAALAGALGWNLIMWRLAIPTSSGHALVGGLAGAFAGVYGLGHVQWSVFTKMFLLLGAVPIAGCLFGYLLTQMSYWLGEFLTPSWGPVLRFFQISALAGSAVTQGSNDGQKSMAMIGLAMAAAGTHNLRQALPWPVTLLCGSSLACGLLLGSRGIIQKLGQKLYHVQPLQGVCAQTATMVLVGLSSLVGCPISSSQMISTSLLGAGIAINPRHVRWQPVTEIGLAWVVTLPVAGLLSAGLGILVKAFYVVP